MKKILFIILLFVSVLYVNAAGPVVVMISDGISNRSVSSKMESGLSALLTEINKASNTGRALNYSGLDIPSDVREVLDMLWENSPFVVSDEMIVEHCITTDKGYQIRCIPLLMKVNGDSGAADDDYQEAVVSFDKSGNIVNFNLSIAMNLIGPFLKQNNRLNDVRLRELILDYVEQFRTSYNQKDIKFLENVFSDDALIITGRVVRHKTGDNIRMKDTIKYKKESKPEYLARLKQVFAANRHIRVTFDEIEVMHHPDENKPIYGVTLHQGWTADRYHDDGYLFMIWDFTDEEHPEIHVRTWQPDRYNGGRLPKDEIFNLNDFDI